MNLLQRIILFLGITALFGSVLFVPYRATLTLIDPRLATDTTKHSRYTAEDISALIAKQSGSDSLRLLQSATSTPAIVAPDVSPDVTMPVQDSLRPDNQTQFIMHNIYENRLIWSLISRDPQADYTPPRGCGMMFDARHDTQLHSSMFIAEILVMTTLLLFLNQTLWKKLSRRVIARMNRPSPEPPDRSNPALNTEKIPKIFAYRPPAGLIARCAAGMIDLLFLSSFALTGTIFWVLLTKPVIAAQPETLLRANQYFFGVCLLFFILTDMIGTMSSPGKFLLRITSSDMYGYRPNILQSLIRSIGKMLTILPPLALLEYVIIIFVTGMSPVIMKDYGHELFHADSPLMGVEKSGLLLPLLGVLSLPFFILSLSPTHQTWYDKIARTLVIARETRKQNALMAIESAMDKASNPVFMNFLTKAQDFFSKGRYAEAIETFKKAINEEPESYDALYGLAGAYLAAKDFPESIATYKDVIKVDPADTRARFGLGMALRQGGKEKDAWRVQADLKTIDANEGQRLHDYLTNYRD
jgi:hypothetical protein